MTLQECIKQLGVVTHRYSSVFTLSSTSLQRQQKNLSCRGNILLYFFIEIGFVLYFNTSYFYSFNTFFFNPAISTSPMTHAYAQLIKLKQVLKSPI